MAATKSSAQERLGMKQPSGRWSTPMRRGDCAGDGSGATVMPSPRSAPSVSRRFIGVYPCRLVLETKISLPHAVIVQQLRARSTHDDATVLQDVGAVRDLERHGDVLLDQQ